jgi:hypothetical protein
MLFSHNITFYKSNFTLFFNHTQSLNANLNILCVKRSLLLQSLNILCYICFPFLFNHNRFTLESSHFSYITSTNFYHNSPQNHSRHPQEQSAYINIYHSCICMTGSSHSELDTLFINHWFKLL